MTVGKYQELYAIENSDISDIEKEIQSVCVLADKTEAQVDDMTITEFKSLRHKVLEGLKQVNLKHEPQRYLRAGKNLYKPNYIPASLRAAQYIEIQKWLQGDVIDNLHLLLASICNPVKSTLGIKTTGKNTSVNHSKIAEEMKEVEFTYAYGSVVFFCTVFQSSIKGLKSYLESEIAKAANPEVAKQTIKDLINTLDGFSMPNELLTSRI